MGNWKETKGVAEGCTGDAMVKGPGVAEWADPKMPPVASPTTQEREAEVSSK